MPKSLVDTVEFFLARLIKNKTTGCLECTLKPDKFGYCRFNTKIKGEKRAHRIAWVIKNGPVPDGMDVLHRCDNRICCSEEHLFLGTQTTNNRDRDLKDRQAKHEVQGSAKLSKDKVKQIRGLYRQGWTQKRLGLEFGVDQTQISKIVRHEDWK